MQPYTPSSAGARVLAGDKMVEAPSPSTDRAASVRTMVQAESRYRGSSAQVIEWFAADPRGVGNSSATGRMEEGGCPFK